MICLFSPQQLYKIVPIKDIRNLYVTFPIPDLQQYYKSNPGHYLGHLIGHEGPGSLLSELKSKGKCLWAAPSECHTPTLSITRSLRSSRKEGFWMTLLGFE